MQQSPLFLSSADLNMMYQKLLQNPRFAQELSDYHRIELYHYAEDEGLNATRTIVDMMDGTPNYPYPEEYRNGREVEYLLGKHSPAYWDSQRVLQLLAERPIASQPAAKVADGTVPSDAVATASTKKMNSKEPRIAKISSGVELHEVKELLSKAGLGRIYTKPGEWAAALRALHVAGILKGNAPEVTRWAVERDYIDPSQQETIKKTWSREWNEAGQFSNIDQRTVFRTTLAAANKLLNEKGLKDKNK